MQSRLTKRFGLTYPVLSAPMANHSGGNLAAAVSEAGGIGLFGTAGATPEWLTGQIALARAKTSKPFGVGFLSQRLAQDEGLFEIALEARLPVLAFSFADPAPWVSRARDAGIATVCQVQDLEGARAAAHAGTDVIVAQGTEAGGHTGRSTLLPLLEAVLDEFPDQIVIAAGGIATGRALAAVLAAGADGAWMGTRFLATTEATEVAPDHRQMILDSTAQDTVFTPVYDIVNGSKWPQDVAARVRRNAFAAEWTGREDELVARLEELRARNLAGRETAPADNRIYYMGTGVGAIRSVRPVADVLREICEEADRLLRRAAG
jgi:nitronate monooxygenase